MKLEELKIVITRIEDSQDKEGNICLKCKGYNAYKQNGRNAYNFFSNIKLYPVNETQFLETKNRLFSQTEDKPKLPIIAYQSELSTPLVNGKIMPSLTVYRFDFVKSKLFRKKEILNYGKDN